MLTDDSDIINMLKTTLPRTISAEGGVALRPCGYSMVLKGVPLIVMLLK